MVILRCSWHFRIWDTTLLLYICVLQMFVCYPFLLCWLSLSFTIGFMPFGFWNVGLLAFGIIWNLASFICWYFSGHGPSPMCRLMCRLMWRSRQRRSHFSASIWFHWWVFHSFLFFFNSVFLYLYCFSVLFFERFSVLFWCPSGHVSLLCLVLISLDARHIAEFSMHIFPVLCFFLSRGVVLVCLVEPRDYRCCFFDCFVPSSFFSSFGSICFIWNSSRSIAIVHFCFSKI